MIWILLALVAVAAFVLPGLLNPIGTGIGDSFTILARGIIFLVIIAMPAIVAIAIFYIAASKDKGKDKMNMIVVGALYGIALYLIMVNFGLLNMALDYFGNITGSWLGSWVPPTWLTTITGVLISVVLFLEGIALAVIDRVIWTVLHLRQAIHGIKQRAKNFNKHFT